MRYDLFPLNPAATAMIAVLALSPLPAMAQLAGPAPAPDAAAAAAPPAAVDPALVPVLPVPETAPAPAAPPMPQAMVQPVPESAAPAPSREPKAVAAEAAPRKAVPEKRVQEDAMAELPPVAAGNGAMPPLPAAAPSDAAAPYDAAAEPAAIPSADAGANDGDLAAAGGLGLAALAALAGVYAVRRRKHGLKAAPATQSEPLELRIEAIVAEPAPVSPEPAGTGRSAPPLSGDQDELVRWREEMVAQPPSSENPFLTRRHRLRRANFLLNRAVESAGEVAATLSSRPQAAKERQPLQPRISYSFAG